MPKTKDYYEILGVARDVDEKTLKAAYRKLARKWHPDVNPGDAAAEDKFKEVSEAFAVLSDPEKRARYDRGGRQAFGPDFDPFAGTGYRWSTGGGATGTADYGFPDLGELFEMFGLGGTGSRVRTRRPVRGRDLEMRLEIPFMDAVEGTTRTLKIPRIESCPECRGRQPRCGRCGGRGSVRTEETVRVRIPAGVEDGNKVRLPAKGDAGEGGGPAGDAYLRLNVTPHPLFRREGADLYVDVPVGIVRASLGGTIKVPTLEGHAEVNLPAGTRSGTRMRLRDRGGPGKDGRRGDLFAVIQIHPPEALDDRSRALLEEFDTLNPS